TQQATEEIRAIIEHLQQSSAEAANAMQQSRKGVEGRVERTEQTARLLAGINRSVEAISVIGVSTREQLANAGEMNRLVEEIGTVADHTRNEADRVAEDSQRLERLAEQLRTLCQQFRVGAQPEHLACPAAPCVRSAVLHLPAVSGGQRRQGGAAGNDQRHRQRAAVV